MTDLPGGDAAARRIHLRMSKPVRYTMPGHTNLAVRAVRTHGPASPLMDDQSPRQLSFEIRKEDLPARPLQGDTLAENDGAGPSWSVIECVDLDDVDAWRVVVVA